MELIQIWVGRSGGVDPTAHYWFDAGGYPERLCDGEPRRAEPDRSAPDVFAPCDLCQDLYLEDVLFGRKSFDLLPYPPKIDTTKNGVCHAEYGEQHASHWVSTIGRWVGTQDNRVYVEAQEVQMTRVSFGMFARFYDERPSGQVRVVRDIRMRLVDREDYKNRDHYGLLRNNLRGTHWATGDITTFERALPSLVGNQKKEFRRKHYEEIGQNYIAFWKAQDAMYFKVPPVDLEFGDLVIRVNPEVGLRTMFDAQILKLWFNATRPTVRMRQVIEYLMGRAQRLSDA